MKTGLTAIAFCLTFCYVPQPSVAQTVPDTLYGIIKNPKPVCTFSPETRKITEKSGKEMPTILGQIWQSRPFHMGQG